MKEDDHLATLKRYGEERYRQGYKDALKDVAQFVQDKGAPRTNRYPASSHAAAVLKHLQANPMATVAEMGKATKIKTGVLRTTLFRLKQAGDVKNDRGRWTAA